MKNLMIGALTKKRKNKLMHQFFNDEKLFQFIEVLFFSSTLFIYLLLTCSKPRRPRTDSNSSNKKPQQRTERQKTTATNTTKTENTRDLGSAPTFSGTPQIQSDKRADTPRRIKKTIKTSKLSNNNHKGTSKRSKREKSKEEKTKKESHLKKFLHKFGGNSEKKDTKTHSFEEAPPEGQNDENEKVPISSRKASRRRKMLGECNNLRTAEDGDVTNTQAEEDPKIVDPVKVVQMGNIDIITQQEKNKRIREIEQMPSGNYCEEPTQLSKSIKKENMHVKIAETNCKLFETNADPVTRSFKESLRRRKKIKHQLRSRSRGSNSK